MATNSAPLSTPNKTLRVAVQASSVPAPPEFTLSATDTTITASIVDGKGAASFEIRLENGTAVSGVKLSGLTAEQTYLVQMRGLSSEGVAGDWSLSQSKTTAATSTGGDPVDNANITLPAPNLYSNGFESGMPDPGDLNTINLNFMGLYNNLGTDLDGGTTGGIVNSGSGIRDPYTPVTGRDWRTIEGDIHLRVRMAAQTGTSNPQQDIEFDSVPARDLWLRCWVRIPFNYYPPTNHITGQHKFLVFFQDGYSEQGTGTTNMLYLYRGSTQDTVTSGITGMTGTTPSSTGHMDKKFFFNYVERRGQWVQMVYLNRLNSSPGAGDGAIKFWYRWAGESSFTLQHEILNKDFERSSTPGMEGFRRARLSSAREGDVAEDMDLLWDLVEFSDTPLVPAGTEGL